MKRCIRGQRKGKAEKVAGELDEKTLKGKLVERQRNGGCHGTENYNA
jgi:hypothetical protein